MGQNHGFWIYQLLYWNSYFFLFDMTLTVVTKNMIILINKREITMQLLPANFFEKKNNKNKFTLSLELEKKIVIVTKSIFQF